MTQTPPDPDATLSVPTTGDEVAFSTRTPRPSRVRVAAVGGAAVALAIGVVATSLAATPAPSAPATNDNTAGVDPAPFFALDPGLAEPGDLDLHRLGGKGYRDITIKAISGSNVTLATDDGWT
ncbi:MAG TPA: hypothetical protein VM408_03515, partial [Methylomirabilota bacterium]|nr:hypothetical protein [Methylomirabilota bacterium]